ncbi:MAG: hypothetical protein K9N52_03580 [Verrucomicrobia bacterium]|nr:hypothetical protein [Verrucomicrobiota bacterium]
MRKYLSNILIIRDLCRGYVEYGFSMEAPKARLDAMFVDVEGAEGC